MDFYVSLLGGRLQGVLKEAWNFGIYPFCLSFMHL